MTEIDKEGWSSEGLELLFKTNDRPQAEEEGDKTQPTQKQQRKKWLWRKWFERRKKKKKEQNIDFQPFPQKYAL